MVPHSHRHWKICGYAFRRGTFYLMSCKLLHCLLITLRILVLIMIEIWPSRVWGVTPVYRIMNIRTLGFFVGPSEKLPLNSVGRYMTPSENKNKFMLSPKVLEHAQTNDPSCGDLSSQKMWRIIWRTRKHCIGSWVLGSHAN